MNYQVAIETSLAKLGNLVHKLERKPELFQQCHKITEEQEEVAQEAVAQEAEGRVFYVPQKPVIRTFAKT